LIYVNRAFAILPRRQTGDDAASNRTIGKLAAAAG